MLSYQDSYFDVPHCSCWMPSILI